MKRFFFTLLLCAWGLSSLAQYKIPELIPYRKGSLWGYCNKEKQIIIKPQFERSFPFLGEVAPVFQGGKCVLIDKKGKVLGTQFDANEQLVKELYADSAFVKEALGVLSVGGQYVAVNKKGEIALNASKFEYLEGFHSGISVFKKGSLQGYVNEQGKEILPAQYSQAVAFGRDYGIVQINPGLYRYVDKTGKILEQWSAPAGAAPCPDGRWNLIIENGRLFFVDLSTGERLAQSFEAARPFREGLAAVSQNGKWGYLDEKGNMAIPFRYFSAGSFEAGYARISFYSQNEAEKYKKEEEKKTSKKDDQPYTVAAYFIDKKGLIVLQAYSFSIHEGMMRVSTERKSGEKISRREAFITTKNQWITGDIFPQTEDFSFGLAQIKDEANRAMGYIDYNGAQYWEE